MGFWADNDRVIQCWGGCKGACSRLQQRRELSAYFLEKRSKKLL
jgi:hypothetical protein